MRTRTKKQSGSNFIEESKTYHSFNRTNNKELLFKADEDYLHFIHCAKIKLSSYVEVTAYTLIPNHFHIQYTVKSISQIESYIKSLPESKRCKTETYFLESNQKNMDIDKVISNQFRRLFIAYSYYFNKKYKRKGNLFYRNFKTKLLNTEFKQKIVLRYIHCNTIKHNMDILPKDYPWCSHNNYFFQEQTIINRKLGLQLFKSIDDFKDFHREYILLHADFLLKKDQLKRLESELFPEL